MVVGMMVEAVRMNIGMVEAMGMTIGMAEVERKSTMMIGMMEAEGKSKGMEPGYVVRSTRGWV